MQKYLFIVNPEAGNGKFNNSLDIISSFMDEKNLKYNIVFTKKPKDGIRLVIENINEYNVFIAVGGDGTINEVAEGISKMNKGILSAIPLGTGNDLAKVLFGKKNIFEILEIIIDDYNTKNIDIGFVNGGYFFNIASIGFDSQVIINYNRFTKFKGRINYLFSAIYTLFNFKYLKLNIKIDDIKIEREVTMLAIGNGKYYGGYFKVLPMADIDDDKLYICMVKNLNKIKMFLFAPLLIFGLHEKVAKYVEVYKCDKLLISSDEKFYLNLDGEILEKTRVAEFQIIGKIKIRH